MVHQRVPAGEEDIGDALLLGDFPDSFLVIEVGRVLGKPHHPDVPSHVRMSHEGSGLLGRVDRTVVQGQDNPFSRLARTQQQATHEEKELGAVLASLAHPWNQRTMLPRRVVEGAEGGNLGILSGRGYLHLLAPSHPGTCQMRVKVEVGFVLEPEFVSGSGPESPFFRA